MICMSLSSKHMGLLSFSPMAFNRVMWSISFAAFYYRFLVAIKMLLKWTDFSVPSPSSSPSLQPSLWWLTPVECRHTRSCAAEKGDAGVGVQAVGEFLVQTLTICTEWEVCRALLSTCPSFPEALSPDARAESARSQELTDTPWTTGGFCISLAIDRGFCRFWTSWESVVWCFHF